MRLLAPLPIAVVPLNEDFTRLSILDPGNGSAPAGIIFEDEEYLGLDDGLDPPDDPTPDDNEPPPDNDDDDDAIDGDAVKDLADVLTVTARKLQARVLGRKFTRRKSVEERKRTSIAARHAAR